MTDEKVHRFCVVCGWRLPDGPTAYELKDMGAASDYGEGQLVFHCIGRHSKERIADAAKFAPGFHRASEQPK